MQLVGLLVPWVAFTHDKIWMDSGFLTLYDLFREIYTKFGWKSLMYLDISHKKSFEEKNDPKETGIYPLYSTTHRSTYFSMEQTIDDVACNDIYLGKHAVDFVITNNYAHVPYLTSAFTRVANIGIPVIYVPLNVGKDANAHPERIASFATASDSFVNTADIFHIHQEAMSYFAAQHVVWTTTDQKARGFAIFRRFFGGSALRQLEKKHTIIGNGLADFLKKYKRTDEKVAQFLKSKKDDFRVSFIGRQTANKNVSYIFDTMQPMYAMHGTMIECKLNKSENFSSKKFSEEDPATNIISQESLGFIEDREEYVSKRLLSVQCLYYASIAEGHNATVREAAYVGAPVLVPTKSWAKACFGEDYPFYHNNQTEAYALIRRIAEGTLSDQEVNAFIKTRNSDYISFFMSDAAQKYTKMLESLILKRIDTYKNVNLARTREVFEKAIPLQEEMTFSNFYRILKKNGLSVKPVRNSASITNSEYVLLFRDRLVITDPLEGIIKRIS